LGKNFEKSFPNRAPSPAINQWKHQCMPEDPLEYLRENQERLGLVMLRHCLIVLGRLYKWSPGKRLPKGKDPETVVEDVIRKYLGGDRNFSPEHSVEAQLKRGVTSWLSALHRTKDGEAVSLEAMTEAIGDCVACDGPQPDADATNAHDTEVLFRLLYAAPAVQKSEELQLLVMAIEEGADDTKSQSAATGIPIERVGELRKKLKTVVPAVLNKFNN
jgi:hypothetical protein